MKSAVIFLSTIMILIGSLSPSLAFAHDIPGGEEHSHIVQCTDDCGYNDLIALIRDIIDFIIKIAVIAAPILFAWAGFLYVTAAGNTGKIAKAHTIFKDVFIGFMIILVAWLVVNTIVGELLNTDEGFEIPLEESV